MNMKTCLLFLLCLLCVSPVYSAGLDQNQAVTEISKLDRLLTPATVARRLSCSTSKVYRLIDEGKLEGVNRERGIMVLESSLIQFLSVRTPIQWKAGELARDNQAPFQSAPVQIVSDKPSDSLRSFSAAADENADKNEIEKAHQAELVLFKKVAQKEMALVIKEFDDARRLKEEQKEQMKQLKAAESRNVWMTVLGIPLLIILIGVWWWWKKGCQSGEVFLKEYNEREAFKKGGIA